MSRYPRRVRIWEEVRVRIQIAPDFSLEPTYTWIALGAAALLVAIRPLWIVTRVAVTLVHELGHALTGMLCGRKFTGFVVRSDMAGHAVTSGPASGFGLGLTTWAGYPAPALFAAALVFTATSGWAAPMLAITALILLVCLVRVRTALTGLVVVATLAAIVALLWWRDDALQASALVGAAAFLLVGGWRQLAAVAASRDQNSDPNRLATLTRVPRTVWVATFALVMATATIVAGWLFADATDLLSRFVN